MNEYAKHFDKNNKYINLLANDKEISKKYSEIWNKIKSLIIKEFNSEPVYNNKYIKTKIKIYSNKIYTNFQHNKIPKDNEYGACLSVILFVIYPSSQDVSNFTYLTFFNEIHTRYIFQVVLLLAHIFLF